MVMDLRDLFAKIVQNFDVIQDSEQIRFINSLRNQYTRQHWLSEKQIKALLAICRRHGIL